MLYNKFTSIVNENLNLIKIDMTFLIVSYSPISGKIKTGLQGSTTSDFFKKCTSCLKFDAHREGSGNDDREVV